MFIAVGCGGVGRGTQGRVTGKTSVAADFHGSARIRIGAQKQMPNVTADYAEDADRKKTEVKSEVTTDLHGWDESRTHLSQRKANVGHRPPQLQGLDSFPTLPKTIGKHAH